jgi:hypothetical protein
MVPEGEYVFVGDNHNDGDYHFPDSYRIFNVNREWFEGWTYYELHHVKIYNYHSYDRDTQILALEEDGSDYEKEKIEL